jgi:multidrug efflux pump subunit AcrB
MMVFIIGGMVLGFSVKQEVFPEVTLDMIRVSVAYPGAGPEEVEEGILLKIEENLTGVDGIKEIKSAAQEGFGVVTAELMSGEDDDRVLQDVKTAVDRIITFPEDAEKPVISKVLNRFEVISVVVYGNISEKSLREHAEIIREELLHLSQSNEAEQNIFYRIYSFFINFLKDTPTRITQVELSGVRPYEISIEISEENLSRYNLTLDQVAQRIRKASLDLPGGTIKTDGGEILIRTKERRYFGPEYETVTILSDPDGTEVRLNDIARVKDTFQETDVLARFDGKPAAMVKVFRVGDQKPTEMSGMVKRYVDEKARMLPESIHIATWNDTTELFESRMNLLLKNAFIGLILVFLVLGLFLQIRLALWVMLGIPISFFGAIFLMPAMDVSINMITLFAFILAIGIVVDDAIIVGESAFTHRQRGKPYQVAAVDGTLEVYMPVIFAVLTSVTAFLPLLFVAGLMGKFIKVIPSVVIAVLVVSLVESLFVLPAHLSLGKPIQASRGIVAFTERVRNGFGSRLDNFIAGPYRRFLELCLRYRYISFAIAVAVLLLTVGMVRGGILKFNFMPEVEGDVIMVSQQMPRGTPVSETARVQELIVQKAQEVVGAYDKERPEGDSVMRHIFSLVGSTFVEAGPLGSDVDSGSHLANTALFLAPSEKRNISASEITGRWRERVGEVPGVESLTFSAQLVHLGDDIDIRLAHEDSTILELAATRVKTSLNQYPGVEDIADNYAKGKPELKIRLKSEARTLGITEEDLGRQLRGAFYGSEALRLQRGRNEVKVMVRYPEEDRKSLRDLDTMRIRSLDGGEVPLHTAAYVKKDRGFSQINRTDRKRVVNITAIVDSKTANAKAILADVQNTVLAGLVADYPGLTYDLVGEEKEQRESFGSMQKGFLLALFGIYALLAIPFRSYSQPVIIMIAIPFGIVGAVLGHRIMGFDLSILSLFGIVALSGVVVNDSLLMIDFINRQRRGTSDLVRAITEAGMRRFRPILLTSLTTFFGLIPIIMEKSVQAQFLIPMAISLAFGVLFATGITLLLIPSLYSILEDLRGIMGLSPFHANHRNDSKIEKEY